MKKIEPEGVVAPGHASDNVSADLFGSDVFEREPSSDSPELVVLFDDDDQIDVDTGQVKKRHVETDNQSAAALPMGRHTTGGGKRRVTPAMAGLLLAVVVFLVVVAVVLWFFVVGTSDGGGDPLPDYESNLGAIKAHTGRNTNHDASPFRLTPQSDLNTSDNSPLITTDRTDYVQWGDIDGGFMHQEFAFPVPTGGQFRTACEFSHFAYDDPILFPGQPGAAHLHMFFGNTDVNAYSTVDSLRNSGGSTCNGAELNRTGYWSPAMIDPDPMAPGGAWVRVPERIVVYYKGEVLANGSNPGAVSGGSQLYRPGMAMVTPQPGVVSVPYDQGGLAEGGFADWKCSSNFSPPGQPESVGQIPVCSGQTYYQDSGAEWTVLEMDVRFPNCFNTAKADDDWTAWEMVGPNDWYVANCTGELQSGDPAAASASGYEVFPHLEYFVNYRVDPDEDTGDWFLSSDVAAMADHDGLTMSGPRGSTVHSDWWGAWHPEINQEWLDNCVNAGWNPDQDGDHSGCGFGYLSNGGPDNQNPLPGRALARRPEWNGPHKIALQTLFDQLCVPHKPDHGYDQPETGAFCLHPTG